MAKSVRMADIAEKLGVSVVTVSKALRGKDGVGDELRAQIIKIAEELGYTAKSTSSESYVIGILTAGRYLERGSSFYWSLYERLLSHLSASGDFGFLEVISAEDEETCAIPRIVQEHRADGLIAMGTLGLPYMKMLGKLRIPLTMLDTYETRLPYDTVISDGYYGMCTMTDYLIRQGHRKLAFVGTLGATSSITDRYYGFCRALTEAGLSPSPDLLFPDRYADGSFRFSIPENITDLATALVCNCDLTAFTVCRHLEEKGIRVPEDITVVGFDDFGTPALHGPSLTTYSVDLDGMAHASAAQIRSRITHPQANRSTVTVCGKMVLRNSVRRME
ncbi:MAG: LacI family DNA-binding transcriptional regulator [Oscillospiraceae bacterium]|nr:LacI family DNA-binding transcriptional regulator [Oscillospiraceae bacterium]